MGNQPPVAAGRGNAGPFRRPNGNLGLTRSELDERCKPSGLYQGCEWDERTIRRLIGDGKLASRQVGKESRENGTEQECPICFLYYDDINMLKCCKATICTECYLQLENPRERDTTCPFCAKPNMSVEVAKKLNLSDAAKRDEEEQKVIEATIRARANSESISLHSDGSEKNFGSRLSEELKRSRSRTMSFEGDTKMSIDEVAMTVDERRELENQMKSQLSHPLMREMQRNAEIESQRHLIEHAERRRDQVRNSREHLERFMERARIREHGLNLFSGAMDHGEDGRPNVDDLYLLEAALFLSAREDSLRRRRVERSRSGRRQRTRDNALLQALMAGQREGGRDIEEFLHARNRSAGENNRDENNDDDDANDEQDRNNRFGLSTADILLAGLSEDSQIEMAIQMSLREAEQQQAQQDNQDNDGDGVGGDNGVGDGVERENIDNSNQQNIDEAPLIPYRENEENGHESISTNTGDVSINENNQNESTDTNTNTGDSENEEIHDRSTGDSENEEIHDRSTGDSGNEETRNESISNDTGNSEHEQNHIQISENTADEIVQNDENNHSENSEDGDVDNQNNLPAPDNQSAEIVDTNEEESEGLIGRVTSPSSETGTEEVTENETN